MIDLRSDTATKPSTEMLKAIVAADYGDEQLDEDQNVAQLCERVADLLGQESAMFLPSGTACNIVATRVVCRSGDALLAAPDAHIMRSECGGGAIWREAAIAPIATLAQEEGLWLHMDGARLLNAAVAVGTEPKRLAAGANSVWVAFSKGLGAPQGAVSYRLIQW